MTVLFGLLIGLMQFGALVALGAILSTWFSKTRDPENDRLVYIAGSVVIITVEGLTLLLLS